MKVYKLYCEYDVDQDYVVFTTEEKAYQHAREALSESFDEDFTWESMLEDGLVSVEELRIDP